MKSGKSIVELAKELERQSKAKRDFIASGKKMNFETRHKEGTKINLDGVSPFYLNDLAKEQIASRLQIPKKYFDRMEVEAPTLLETNVNHWLQNNDDKYMVRTLDGKARAFLSSRFRPLDNEQLAEAVLPTLGKMDIQIVSAEVTEKHLYIKAVTEKLTGEIKKGDTVQAGIVISNSEVGCGAVKIEPMIYRLVCLNGLISADSSMRKYHVGRSSDNDEVLREYLMDETKRADDKAFWMKVRDIVKASLEKDLFNMIVNKFKDSQERKISAQPIDVIEIAKDRYAISEDEGKSVLQHLLTGGDLSQFGLVNAITRTSQDFQDYERATDFERLGGEILELKGKPWENLAQAVA